jgi:hypothetical protein
VSRAASFFPKKTNNTYNSCSQFLGKQIFFFFDMGSNVAQALLKLLGTSDPQLPEKLKLHVCATVPSSEMLLILLAKQQIISSRNQTKVMECREQNHF